MSFSAREGWSVHANTGGRPVRPKSAISRSCESQDIADGLNELTSLDVEASLGFSPDQLAFLKALRSGRSVAMTAPGGTGKTRVLTHYIMARQADANRPTEIFALSVDHRSPLSKYITVWQPTQIDDLVSKARSIKMSGKKMILIVEEHSCLTRTLLANFGLFHQLIIVGDTAQGSYDYISFLLRDAITQYRIQHLSTSMVWRSRNSTQFNILGALVYQGRYETYGKGSEELPDSIRAKIVDHPITMPSTGSVIRVIRSLGSNKTTTLTYVVSTKEQVVRMLSGLISAAKIEVFPQRFRIVHRSLLQGTEADVLLMDAATLNIQNRDEIEKSLILLLGRARYRIELLLDRTWLERDHAKMAVALLGTRFETIPAHPELTSYAQLAKQVEQDGRFVLGANLSHFSLRAKEGGKPSLLINVMGKDVVETAHKQRAAKSNGWNVITEPIEVFGPVFSENNSIIKEIIDAIRK